jgi:hypothetical protein
MFGHAYLIAKAREIGGIRHEYDPSNSAISITLMTLITLACIWDTAMLFAIAIFSFTLSVSIIVITQKMYHENVEAPFFYTGENFFQLMAIVLILCPVLLVMLLVKVTRRIKNR